MAQLGRADFYIRKGDRLSVIEVTLTGVVTSDLTGAAGTFVMRDEDGVETTKTNIELDTVNLKARYAWEVGSTLTPGYYECRFELALASGQATFPDDSDITVLVVD